MSATVLDTLFSSNPDKRELDGKVYRLQHGTYSLFKENSAHPQLSKHPLSTAIQKDIADLQKLYPSSDSPIESLDNARRRTLFNIESDVAHILAGDEVKFEQESQNPFKNVSAQKAWLNFINLYRIYWVFIRFNLNELLLSVGKICAAAAVVDSATLSAFLDNINGPMWFLSVALFASRLLIELGLILKHVIKKDGMYKDKSSLEIFWMEWDKRKSDIANCLVWGSINALTNFPQLFGIPVAVCFPLVSVVLLFDIWIAFRRHTEASRKITSAIKLVDKDKESLQKELAAALGQEKTQSLMNNFSFANYQAILQATKEKTTAKDADTLITLQKLEAIMLERQMLKDKKIILDESFRWQQSAAILIFGAFSLSVALSFMATPPGIILACYLLVSVGIAGYMKEGDFAAYRSLQQARNNAEKNIDFLFSERELAGLYKPMATREAEAAKRLKHLDSQIVRKQNNLIIDIAAMAIIPPLLIGSLAICWPLTVAVIGITALYLGHRYYQQKLDKQENDKPVLLSRYRLFADEKPSVFKSYRSGEDEQKPTEIKSAMMLPSATLGVN